MAVGVYVPFLALVFLVVVVVCVAIFKGINLAKNLVVVLITAILALMISYVIMFATMPDLFVAMIEPWRGIALSFVNAGLGSPIAMVIYYPVKTLLGFLGWTKVIGSK